MKGGEMRRMRLPELKNLNQAVRFARELNRKYRLQLEMCRPKHNFVIGDYLAILKSPVIFRRSVYGVVIGAVIDRCGGERLEVIKMTWFLSDREGYIINARYALHPVPLAGLMFSTAILGMEKFYPYLKLTDDFNSACIAFWRIGGDEKGVVNIVRDGMLISPDEWLATWRRMAAVEFYDSV